MPCCSSRAPDRSDKHDRVTACRSEPSRPRLDPRPGNCRRTSIGAHLAAAARRCLIRAVSWSVLRCRPRTSPLPRSRQTVSVRIKLRLHVPIGYGQRRRREECKKEGMASDGFASKGGDTGGVAHVTLVLRPQSCCQGAAPCWHYGPHMYL